MTSKEELTDLAEIHTPEYLYRAGTPARILLRE